MTPGSFQSSLSDVLGGSLSAGLRSRLTPAVADKMAAVADRWNKRFFPVKDPIKDTGE